MSATLPSVETAARNAAPAGRQSVGLRGPHHFWHPAVGFFVVIWLLLLAAGQTRFFRDPGTFWHIVVGERVLSTGRLMRTDELTYTRHGVPWAPYEWLGECGMALLHRAGGFDLVLLAGVTLLAALYAWLAWRLLRAGLHWLWVAALIALILGVSAAHFHLRPHLVTIVFTAVTFVLLGAVEAGRLRLAWLGLLPPLFALWANIHGGVLAGYGMIGLAAAGWCVYRLLGLPSPLRSWKEAGGVLLLTALCLLTSLAGPGGIEVPATWMYIMRSPVIPQMVQEHAPTDLVSFTGMTALLLLGLYLIVLATTRPRIPRLTWLLPLVWAWLGWSRSRHLDLFAVTAGLGLAEMLPFSRLASRLLEGRESGTANRAGFPRPALLPALSLVLLAAALQITGVRVPVVGAGWGGPDPALWPVALVGDLRREADKRSTHIFNEFSQGGFLSYYAPQVPTFIDDRCEVMGDDFLQEYSRAQRIDTAGTVHAWDRRWGFTLALVWRDSPFDDFFAHEAGWVEVGRTENARLYRREPRPE